MKKQLLILMTLFTVVIGYSQSTYTFGGMEFTYTTGSGTAVITDYAAGAGPNVNIPSSITVGLQYDVIGIETGAFQQKGLNSVTIPNSITSIGANAFRDNNLTSVTIPDSVSSLGQAAFRDNQISNLIIGNGITSISVHAFLGNNLTSVNIPNTITSIGTSAFSSNQLTSIIIPSSVTTIADFAFYLNPLAQVTSYATTPPIITTNPSFDSFSGNRGNIDLLIPQGTTAAYVTDPGALWTGFNSVSEMLVVGNTFVDDYISYQVTSASANTVEIINYDVSGGSIVNIPATVFKNGETYDITSIAANAFNSKGLSNVSISDGIINIGSQAFVNNSISDLVLGNSIQTIGGLAFDSNNLTNVVIPNSVTSIGARAFDDNQITNVIIGSSVTNIEFGAFRNNLLETVISLAVTPPTIVTSTSFPSVTDSFNHDRSNINLVITNTTTDEYVTDSGALWTGFKMVFEATSPTTAEVSNYDPANGTNVSVPASVTAGSNVFDVNRIDDSAFENIGLTSVTIPDSVTEIGISAFNLNNLTSVTIPDSVTLIGTTAFGQNSVSNLSLGANITDIGIGAFVDNNLTNVTIPSNVTFIGLLAFGNNPLTSVTSYATTPPTITTGTNDTFAFNRSNIELHIPPGTLGAYVTDPGALWTGFNPVTQDASLSTSNFELEHGIKIITNKDELKIIVSGSIKLESYTVYSISGAKVNNGTKSTIAIDNLSRGVYILELTFDTGKLVKKFAK